MEAFGIAGAEGDQDNLTEKQCQVLDLLIEHKTSKEIARALGISPHTVDQRISLARGKLGVSSRNELAARYRAMKKIPGQPTFDVLACAKGEQLEAVYQSAVYGPPSVDPNEFSGHHQAGQRDDALNAPVPDWERFLCPTEGKIDHRVGPEMFEGSSGGLLRLGAIVATALLLAMTVLVLFAIFDQLSDMLA